MLTRLLRTYLFPYRNWLVVVVLAQLASSIAMLYLPTLNADIIDNGIAKGDSDHILHVGGWMLLISVGQIACSALSVYFASRAAMSAGRDMRQAVFNQVGTFSGREMAHFGAPSLITRNTNDVQQVQMLIVMTCTLMVSAPIMGIGGIIMALREDLGLSAVVAVSLPLLAGLVTLIAWRMVPQFRAMQTKLDGVNRVLREQITGVRVVRAFVREPVEAQRFHVTNDDLGRTALKAGRLIALLFPVVMLIMNVSSVALLWFGAGRVDSGSLQVGSLTAFMAYLVQILMSVMMAAFMLIMVPRAAVSAERITEVLDTDSSVAPPADPVRELPGRGEVEFRNVSFSYPGADTPVLHGVSFQVRPGQLTGIIGATGAGKTTLISLVARLFDATEGQVLVDGVDVRQIEPELLWARLGLVPQRSFLFSGTVASNLRYGDPEADEAMLWDALTVAQARDFVEAMPDGLAAPIAQGGTNVSGGQRQRLAIARALVRRPEIYLFDDAFSALDVATDARLRRALRGATREAAVLVVAQRVSTIREADQILVLEDGQIVGVGTHDELIASCGEYAEIVSSQLSVDDDEPVVA